MSMKQFRFYALLLFVLTVTSSCKKVPVLDWITPNLSFKIDGAAKEVKGSKNALAIYVKELNIMHISGIVSEDEQINLTIGNFHGVGEYTIEGEDLLGLYTSTDLPQSLIGTEGKVKITEFVNEKTIKGEFQFKGELFIIHIGTDNTDPDSGPAETKTISDGKFQLNVTIGKPEDIESGDVDIEID
ncbi:hypothetical protein SAMN04488524_3578 [Pedobacter africanus]|uniref:Uncharacterized protein n=2 Tax=Pedobacter africanus TaxID=151894 RepID=A0A1W2DBX6_9SPHI|nr:hypothetical protein SAMN04488524_3578 [Pedobacter africanus]